MLKIAGDQKRDRKNDPQPPEALLSQRRPESNTDNPLGRLLWFVQRGQKPA